MDRHFYHPHKLYYKRRPTAKPESYFGVEDALVELGSKDDPDECRIHINGIGKDLMLYVGQEEMETENQNQNRLLTPRLIGLDSEKPVMSTRESVSAPNFGYGQLRDSKVYKRTRYLYQSPREPGQWPVGLELSGRKIMDGQLSGAVSQEGIHQQRQNSPVEKEESDIQKILETIPRLSRTGMRPLGSPTRPHKVCLSPSFYSDFGLRSERSDTFSGFRRVRRFNSSLGSDFERQIKEKANRHIYACQTQNSSRRGSRAAQGLDQLKQTVGPARNTTTLELPTQYVRSMSRNLERNATFVDVTRRPQYALFIRTRDRSSITPDYAMKRNKTDPLPEISGRTMVLGYEDRVVL
ncbi:hypothetical protein FSP39_023134 [Pinctada imbricata]|uniref:Uncharacterized protein n=1 Tax=Pinctada imbricata TaxID=66713 RepID=A0AA88YLV1_PINIB|nr:hypothetical protein FSP39_023134 [Pinctada imbricata]